MTILIVSIVVLLLCQILRKVWLRKQREVKDLLKCQFEAGVQKAKIVIAVGVALVVFQFASFLGIILGVSKLFS